MGHGVSSVIQAITKPKDLLLATFSCILLLRCHDPACEVKFLAVHLNRAKPETCPRRENEYLELLIAQITSIDEDN